MLIGMIKHGGIGGLQPSEEALLVGAVGRPGLDAIIAWRQSRRFRHNAKGLLARNASIALYIPAVVEDRIVALDEFEGSLMRGMTRAESEP